MAGLGIAGAQTPIATRDRIRGDELLSDEERSAYLERLRLARTEQERERIRQEHRDKRELRRRALNSPRGTAPGIGSGPGPAYGMHPKPPMLLPKKGVARP